MISWNKYKEHCFLRLILPCSITTSTQFYPCIGKRSAILLIVIIKIILHLKMKFISIIFKKIQFEISFEWTDISSLFLSFLFLWFYYFYIFQMRRLFRRNSTILDGVHKMKWLYYDIKNKYKNEKGRFLSKEAARYMKSIYWIIFYVIFRLTFLFSIIAHLYKFIRELKTSSSLLK